MHMCASESTSDPPEHYNLDFDINNYTVALRRPPTGRSSSINNFLEDGKNMADTCFFRGLESHFNLEKYGRDYIYAFPN